MKEDEKDLDEDLSFLELFDIDQIQMMQDAFSDATGVASIITDRVGTPLTKPSNFCRLCSLIRSTKKGLANCMKSDSILGEEKVGGPTVQPCLSSGLWDGGTSIIVGGVHIANWLIGQVRDPGMSDEVLLAYAENIGADLEEYKSAMMEVTILSSDRFEKICNFLYIMAKQMSELAYKNIMEKRANKEKEELQEKLNQKNKMDALGQLTGGIAHDFNNMLMGILGASQYLKSSIPELNEEGQDFADLIIETTNRAADLTDKLLSFSRKSDRLFKALDIHRIIDETIAILERSIDKKITISFHGEALNHVVRGNLSDLQNSFLNLGINSSHALKGKRGALIFKTSDIVVDHNYADKNHLKLQPGNYLQISVRDTGCGIPREYLHKVFEPFFTTKKQGEGTGLGLSTVYGVIDNHGGTISVYSEEGIGTEFFIYLPLAENHELDMSAHPEDELHRGSGRIYLVDDEEMILLAISSNLTDLGYEVITFSNPLDAVYHFEKDFKEVDLVISDMIMPEGNGIDLFYRLKEINPDCKVIISSGFSQDHDLSQAYEDGLAGYLSKPYSTSELSRMVKNVIFPD